MNEKEAKEILNDPKKLLDLFRLFHQLIHVYEAQEMKKQLFKLPKTNEFVGLSDQLDIQVLNKNQEAK
jgi:hypothetical protein